LFESDGGTGNVYEFANGTKTLYASGFQHPAGLAFNSAGDLFVANALNNGYVSEITPTGTSTILPGLDVPQGLGFDSSGDLFIAVAGPGNGSIMEINSDGTTQTFSTEVATPEGQAFAPVPEPPTVALLAMGASAVALRLRRKARARLPSENLLSLRPCQTESLGAFTIEYH
jgi:DNA-binding beta-propeller fold protein YncE